MGAPLTKLIICVYPPQVSGPPMELQIVDWSPESFLFVWRDPLKPNGRITHYKVYVTELEPLYYVPAHCQDEVPPRVVIDATAVLKEFAAVLRPYTKYELSVRGVNGAGDGQSVTIIGVTSPSGEFAVNRGIWSCSLSYFLVRI